MGIATAPKWVGVYALALLSLRARGVSAADQFALYFLGWAALSLLWSADWRYGVYGWVNMAALYLVFRGARHISDKAMRWAISLSLIGAVFFYAMWTDIHGGFGNENFVDEYMLAATAGSHPYAMAIGVGWLITSSNSSVVYLVAGGLAAALGFRHFGVKVIYGLIPVALAMYFVAPVDSILSRLELIINTGMAWLDSPVFGHGLGSFNYVYEFHREDHFQWIPEAGTILQEVTTYPGAAHNDYLQLLMELGAVGGAIAVAFFFHLNWCWKYSWPLITIGLCSLVGFPLLNPATAVLAALMLGKMVTEDEPPKMRFGFYLVIPLVAIWSLALLYSSASYAGTVRNWVVNPIAAMQYNVEAHKHFPFERVYRQQLIISAHHIKDAEISPSAQERLWEIALTAGRSPSALILRAGNFMTEGRCEEASKLVEELLQRVKRQKETWSSLKKLEMCWQRRQRSHSLDTPQ